MNTNQLIMTENVFGQIISTIGKQEPERGGILGAGKDGLISHYYFDACAQVSPDSYEPDIDSVNRVLVQEWLPNGIRMVGIVHSHSNGNNVPSCGDIHYGMHILHSLDNADQFYLPIITGSLSSPELSAFVITRDAELGYVCKAVDWIIA